MHVSSPPMRLTAAAVIAIAVAVIVYLVTRGHAAAPAAPAEVPASAPEKAPTPSEAHTAPPGPHLRFLADDAARLRVMTAIAEARARRTGTATGTPPGRTPSLDEPDPAPPAMSAEEIRSSFKEVVPLLVECYEQALPHLATKDGTVKVHMRASGEPDVGTLIETADLDTDGRFLDDKDLAECLQETLMSVELPPMPEGGVVEITYPLAFQQAPD